MKKYNVILNAISYVFGSFFIQGLRFVTLPFFSRIMDTDEYALLSSYETWISIITILVGVQASSTINNAYIELGDNKIKSYVADIAVLGLLTSAAAVICTLFGGSIFNRLFELKTMYLLLGVIQCLFTYYLTLFTTSCRILNNTARYLAFSILNSVLSVGMGMLFVWIMPSNKHIGRIYASVFSAIFIGGIACIIIYREGKHFFDKKNIIYAVNLSVPLIFHAFGGIILGRADQIMLLKLVGRSTMGIYSYGTNFAHIIYVLGNSCNLAYIPFYYSLKNANKTNQIVQINKIYIAVYCLSIAAIINMFPEIIKIMSGSQYYDAIYSAPLLGIAFMVNFLYTFPVNHEFFHKKTKYIAFATVVSAVLNIGLNWVFLPFFGAIGAALATLLSTIFQFIIHYYVAQKIIGSYEMPRYVFLTAFACIGVFIFLYYSLVEMPAIRIWITIILFIICLLFIWKNKKILRGMWNAD